MARAGARGSAPVSKTPAIRETERLIGRADVGPLAVKLSATPYLADCGSGRLTVGGTSFTVTSTLEVPMSPSGPDRSAWPCTSRIGINMRGRQTTRRRAAVAKGPPVRIRQRPSRNRAGERRGRSRIGRKAAAGADRDREAVSSSQLKLPT